MLLDPDHLLPRVFADEIDKHARADAEACLARGDAARARRLLESVTTPPLDRGASITLFAARLLAGVPETVARADLDRALAELEKPEERQAALLAAAEQLLAQGAPLAALPLLQALDREVAQGATIPRLLGLTLRALGREDEAQAALRRALARRPADELTRAALGADIKPEDDATPREPDIITLEPAHAKEHPALEASATTGTRALALSNGRIAILAAGARAILTAAKGELARPLEGFAPSGAIDLVALDPDSARPSLVVLESQRLRSRLTLLQVAEDGSARVVAVHERVPGAARGLLAMPTGGLLVAWVAADGRWEWRRFPEDLRRSSAGPDDDDGLRRIRVADDARFEPFAVTAAPWEQATGPGAVWHAAGDCLAVIAEDGHALRCASREGITLDASSRILGARNVSDAGGVGDGLALLVRRQLVASPIAQDAEHRLELRVMPSGADGDISHVLPDHVLDASLARDGGLVTKSPASAGCGAKSSRVDRGHVNLTGPQPDRVDAQPGGG
jgi:hypothetical protein